MNPNTPPSHTPPLSGTERPGFDVRAKVGEALRNPGELSPDHKTEVLRSLRYPPGATPETVTRIRNTLAENSRFFQAVQAMIQLGGEPAVFRIDNEGFEVGTCSEMSPLKTRDTVYDSATERAIAAMAKKEDAIVTADQLQAGNAVTLGLFHGLSLMTQEQYSAAQALWPLDTAGAKTQEGEVADMEAWQNESWLEDGNVGCRRDGKVIIEMTSPFNHSRWRGARYAIKVPWGK